MTADHFTGSDGAITIGGNAVTVVTFAVDLDRSVITSNQVGKVGPKKYSGQLDMTGSITQVLQTAELLSYVMGDSDTLTTSTLETLLDTTDVSANAWSEVAITSDPAAPTSVKCTLIAGDASVNAGSIVIRGNDASGGIVAEVIDFAAMEYGDASQVVYGSRVFTTTDYVDVSGNLQPTPSAVSNSLKIEGVTGTNTMSPGDATLFDIVGTATDGTNSISITANNCFFSAGNFPLGDPNTLVDCNLPFVMSDIDDDLTLSWSAT